MALTLRQQAMLQTNGDLLNRCKVAIYNKCAPIYVNGAIPNGVIPARQSVAVPIAKKIADSLNDFAPRAAKQIVLQVNASMQQTESQPGATPVTFTDDQIANMSDTTTLVPDSTLITAMDTFYLVVANDNTFTV